MPKIDSYDNFISLCHIFYKWKISERLAENMKKEEIKMEYNVKKEFKEEKEEILQPITVEETCTVFIKEEDVKNEFLGTD